MNNEQISKERKPVGLKIWLWLMLIVNVVTAFLNIFGFIDAVKNPIPDVPRIAFLFFAVFGFIVVAAVISLMEWKIWGFYAIAGVAVITLIMNIAIGVEFAQAIFGLAGPVILYLFMRPHWDRFDTQNP